MFLILLQTSKKPPNSKSKQKRENEYSRFVLVSRFLSKIKIKIIKLGVKINYKYFLINNCASATRERNNCSAYETQFQALVQDGQILQLKNKKLTEK